MIQTLYCLYRSGVIMERLSHTHDDDIGNPLSLLIQAACEVDDLFHDLTAV